MVSRFFFGIVMDELFKKEASAFIGQLHAVSLKAQYELADLRIQIIRFIDYALKKMVEEKAEVRACSINSITSGHDNEVIVAILQDVQAAIPGIWIDYHKGRPTLLLIHLRNNLRNTH